MASVWNSTVYQCGHSEDLFGPQVRDCHGTFDFTLLFEQSIFSIGPSALLLLASPLRLVLLSRGDIRTGRNSWLYILKLITIFVYAGLQLVLLVYWSSLPTPKPWTAFAAALLSLLDSFVICTLSHFEHTRTIRPSSFLSIYLFFSCLFDVVQRRTLWIREDFRTIASIFTASLIIKCLLLILEAQEKRRLLRVQILPSPEATSGIYNRSFLWWLNSLFVRGFRGVLSYDDLFTTDEGLSSGRLQKLIQWSWNKYNKIQSHRLLSATFSAAKWPLLAGMVPRLCLAGFTYTQPFLVNSAVDFVSGPIGDGTKNTGYFLIGVTGVIYIGIALSTVHYKHQTFRALTMIRGSLVSLIFTKTLDIATNNLDDAAAITLMSTDFERVAKGFENIHEIWAGIIEIGLGIWLLERQIGVACLVPVVIAITCTFSNSYVSIRVGPYVALWNRVVQKRVAVTSSALTSMKSVKMLGLTDRLSDEIQSLRISEMNASKKFRKLVVWVYLFAKSPAIITPFVTFAVYSAVERSKNTSSFTVAQAFTSLSIISLLTDPLQRILTTIPDLAAVLGCFDRIQKFVLLTGREDHRLLQAGTVPVTGESLAHGASPSGRSLSIEMDLLRTERPYTRSMQTRDTLEIDDGSFGIKLGSVPILQDISIQFDPSSFTMIVGPVGSGKSTLLKALLGELPGSKGFVRVTSAEIAYCDQSPWLTNNTVRDNIIGTSPLDEAWYETVLNACALKHDITGFPRLGLTVVGSGGLLLSGGQKQRVSLTRAVYARKGTVIMDDIFSGLDGTTEETVFKRLLERDGLFRQLGTTVIFATHAVHHLRSADNIIVLGIDGKIVEQGTFEQLNARNGYVQSLLLQSRRQKILENDAKDGPLTAAQDAVPPAEIQPIDSTRQTGDIADYAYYFKSIGLPYTVTILAILTVLTFGTTFPQEWLRLWANEEATHQGRDAAMYLGVYGTLAGLGMLGLAGSLTVMFLYIVPKSANGLHWILLKNVMRAPLSYFVATDSGLILNRFSQDMQLVDTALPESFYYTVSALFMCIAQAILISTGASYIAVTVPFCIVIIYFVQKIYLRTSRQLRIMDLEAKSPLYTHFTETLAGLTTIRAFGLQHSFQERNIELLDGSQRPYYLLFCIQRWLNLVLDLVVAGLAVVLVAAAVEFRSTTSGGAIGVALVNVLSFNQTLAQLITSWVKLETSLGAIARLKSFQTKTKSEELVQESQIPPESWPHSGAIEFENVSASYRSDLHLALSNITLSIKSGEKIGICGRSGSGKSSLILPLFRLLDLTSGNITIDKLSLPLIPRSVIRSSVIAIPQDPFFRPGSILSNLDPDFSLSTSTIISVLERVSLWQLISSLGGLEVSLLDAGFSKGQQQLLSLAATILRKKGREKGVLVLDEATSSVDRETEGLMMRVIREEFAEWTVIAVAHRLETIIDFDRVIVMDRAAV